MKTIKNQIILTIFALFFCNAAFCAENLKDMDGHDVSFESLISSKPTLVHLWASWCGSCMVELPAYQAFVEAHESDAFNIIAVSVDNKPVAEVNQMIQSKVPGLKTYYDPKFSLLNFFKVKGIPYTAILNLKKQDPIQFDFAGQIDWQNEENQQELLSFLKEKK